MDWLNGWLDKPLAVGETAPDFSLNSSEGAQVRLRDLRGQFVVLVWYPGDDTPGCTKQMCDFRDSYASLKAQGWRIFGINSQSAESHQRFRQKYHLPFPLLIDLGQKVGQLYRTRGPIARRTVYVIDPEGFIAHSERGMPGAKSLLARVEAYTVGGKTYSIK
jgi:thioredoxin-dependent peroxiredoxin